ncbi:MAG: D-alanyl-lipoteichoic acid biosynthesis protein DltB [Clostridiales Family XIII bacterium]|nr:D-alanyl-lipoteichoic acid biosynthesis protein DltB [Clostridiales Family XIII bacterium]
MYFAIFGVAVIPAALLLLAGKRELWYQCLLALFFLFMSFGGDNYRQGIALLAYMGFQMLLSQGYFLYRRKRNSTAVFIGAVILALLPLAAAKLSTVAFEELSAAGFLGISYLTFKSVQVIIEMRDGLIKEYRLWRYVQFLLFFPTISAGPIDRYRRFEAELMARPIPERYAEMIGKGIHNIFLGFLYNYILGHLLGRELLPLIKEYTLTEGSAFLGSLLYMYVYSLFLFFDFAGYSKFAIGVSNLLGYETPANFDKPFLSRNIKDFWNRWHMSLSFWFRDYVYMRLLMTLLKKKLCKSRVVASNIAYFALFLLMGVWHGLTWYYIAYGLYHAVIMCTNDAWLRYKKKHHERIPQGRLTNVLAGVITFHAICMGFLIFSGFLNELW